MCDEFQMSYNNNSCFQLLRNYKFPRHCILWNIKNNSHNNNNNNCQHLSSTSLSTLLSPFYRWRNWGTFSPHNNSVRCNTGIPRFTVLQFIILHRCYCFYKLKVCGNLALNKSMSAIFFNSIFSLPVSVSHFGNSGNISNFFIIIFVIVSVILDLWCYYCDSQKTQMIVRIFLAIKYFFFFFLKYFLIKVRTLVFRHNAIAHLIVYSIV